MSEIIEKRCILPDDIFKLKILQDGLLSPDGTKAVYTVSWVETETMDEFCNLWLVDLASGQSRQLTHGKWREGGIAWSPDGKQIAFLSNRSDSKPQIFLLPTDGGEAFQVTKLEQGVGGAPVWSPDGKQIAFTAAELPKEKPDPQKPYRVTRSIYRFDGAGYLDPLVQDIYTIDAFNPGEPRRLTNDRALKQAPSWSPDGEQILFISLLKPDSLSLFSSLKAVDMAGNVREILSDEWGSIESARFTPDGEKIIFAGVTKGSTIGSKTNLWLIDPNGSTPPICRTTQLTWGLCGALRSDLPKSWRAMNSPLLIFSQDGASVFTTVHVGGSIFIYQIALQGKETYRPLIANPERPCVLMDVGEKTLLYAVSTPDLPCDLFAADLDGKNEIRLTSLNDAVLAEWKLALPERIEYANQNNVQIEGWLMKPPVGAGPFPTILYIHGGPHSAYGNMFSFDYQMLAGAGYAVLYINQSGSSGYGDDFAGCILANWGDLVFDDLMRAVDLVVARGVANPNQLGCYGLSYGGYMSSWIVGHTDRFKASIPENPVTNLVSFYGTSDIGPQFLEEEMGGPLPDKLQLYIEQSPVTHAHRCVTPTLMIQGEADYRCPIEQGEQFYTILKAHGCTVEMVRLPGSPHSGSISGTPTTRQYANQAMLDWFDKYVKGK